MALQRSCRRHVTARRRAVWGAAVLSALAALLLASSGCQRDARPLAHQQVSVAPVLGGMGGFMIQIASTQSDLVSVYHAPLEAFERREPAAQSVPFRLLFQFNSGDAGADSLPVRRQPPEASPSSGKPSEEPAAANTDRPAGPASGRQALSASQQPSGPPGPTDGGQLAHSMASAFAAAVQDHDSQRMQRSESVYGFDPEEIDIDDDYVESIRFVRSPDGELTASVTLFNQTQQNWRPRVRFLVANRYGITLEQAQLSWTLGTVRAQERRLETLKFSSVQHADIFRLLGEEVADQFATPFALIVQYGP